MDASTVDAVVSALTAAIGTYGREVLVRVEERPGTPRRTWVSGCWHGCGAERKTGAAVDEAVADVAENPGTRTSTLPCAPR